MRDLDFALDILLKETTWPGPFAGMKTNMGDCMTRRGRAHEEGDLDITWAIRGRNTTSQVPHAGMKTSYPN